MRDTAGRLTVDLGAVADNHRALRRLHPSGDVAGVVKADAYGLGAARVAPALRAAGCTRFFVAQLAEGVALRGVLGAGPLIAVLNGFPPGADGDAALVPVLNGPGDVAAWRDAARRDGAARAAMLHLDTGMNRLGLEAEEEEAMAADPGWLDGLRLLFVMTHLACADEPSHPLNREQPTRFARRCAQHFPGVPRSLSNSCGLFLPGTASDLARPGCATYGINPTPGSPNPMRPVVRLDAPVLQVRTVRPGESVGYGAHWVAARPSRVATVAAGYADGYLRSLSGRGAARFRGREVPLLGRVSMDLSAFDVSDLPDLVPGDRLELLGPGLDADALAARAGTIGYEVLTALGSRYIRDYQPA